MRTVDPREASVGEALALGPALLARAAADGVPCLGASVVRGPALVLGAMQRAGRVVRLDACAAAGATLARRATSGTAAYLEGTGIVWALALPHVASLMADATPRTLLNRNVRRFLAGFRRAGAVAHYFGREWVAVQRRPAAILGFDVRPEGAVLLEVIASMEGSLAVPDALATDDERAVDRWRGARPLPLAEVVQADAAHVARAMMAAIAERSPSPREPLAIGPLAALPPVAGADDPMPPGCVARAGLRVPIGWIDVGFDEAARRAWIGGDVLAPVHVLAQIADGTAPPSDVALEGATLDDLREAAALASA